MVLMMMGKKMEIQRWLTSKHEKQSGVYFQFLFIPFVIILIYTSWIEELYYISPSLEILCRMQIDHQHILLVYLRLYLMRCQ